MSFAVTKKKLVCAIIEVMWEGENSSIKNFSYNKEMASLSLSLFSFSSCSSPMPARNRCYSGTSPFMSLKKSSSCIAPLDRSCKHFYDGTTIINILRRNFVWYLMALYIDSNDTFNQGVHWLKWFIYQYICWLLTDTFFVKRCFL